MLKRAIYLVLFSLMMISFTSCSKDVDEYNKPAMYWYGKMINSISNGDLEKADNYYTSLQGEHMGSPLLPQATFIMALSHMYNEEYLLAEHYLDEYVRRFAASDSQREEAEFLKIKSKYLSLPNPRRDQALVDEAIIEAKNFKIKYPNSIHYYTVDSMLTRLILAKEVLNETIANLYERIDKPKGAKYYRSLETEKWINWDEITRAQTPWYREWFEGDGTSSWYAFLIPDTRSVVSRNSIQDDEDMNKTKEEINETK